MLSNHWLNWSMRPTSLAAMFLHVGVIHREDNIGSSVKLTNRDTSTAAATVMPNS